MRYYRRVNGRLSAADQEDCLQRAVHDLELEGMCPSVYEVDLVRDVLCGKITMDEFSKRILKDGR